MTLVVLAHHLAAQREDQDRWRLIAEFLEEYRNEAAPERIALLADEPPATGDDR